MYLEVLQKEKDESVIEYLQQIKTMLQKQQKINPLLVMDNETFCKTLNISKRTAQTWRDEGKISFSQIGAKIFYKKEDLDKFFDDNRVLQFSKRR